MDWLPTLETTFHIHSVLGWRNKLNKHGLRPHLWAWAVVPLEKRFNCLRPCLEPWKDKTPMGKSCWCCCQILCRDPIKFNQTTKSACHVSPWCLVHTTHTHSKPATPSTYPSVTYRAAAVVVGHQHRLLAVGALTQAARHRHALLENICRCTKIYFVSESAE